MFTRVSKDFRYIAGIPFALLAVFVVLRADTRLAREKPFWLDEGHEIRESCKPGYASILAWGPPGQCSVPPLYYLAQKAVIDSTVTFDEGILARYRLVSLVSGGLCLAVLFLALLPTLGIGAAALALTLLNNQPLFHLYAAENRPYMAWLSCFTALLCCGALLAWKENAGGKPVLAGKAIFAVLCLALALVASPGMLQAIAVCLVCMAVTRAPKAAFYWACILAAGTIGVFYGLKSPCLNYDAEQFDLLRTGNLGLVWPVLRLVWPRGSLATAFFNALFVLGLISPALLRGQANADPAARFAKTLGALAAAQLLVTIPIAGLVIWKHYYFIERIFIHLVACRAILVALGGFFVLRGLRIIAQTPSLQTAAQAAFFIIALLSLAKTDKTIAALGYSSQRPAPTAAAPPCAPFEGSLEVFRKTASPPEASANFIVRFARELERCGRRRAPGSRTLLMAEEAPGSKEWYRIVKTVPAGFVPMTQGSRTVIF